MSQKRGSHCAPTGAPDWLGALGAINISLLTERRPLMAVFNGRQTSSMLLTSKSLSNDREADM